MADRVREPGDDDDVGEGKLVELGDILFDNKLKEAHGLLGRVGLSKVRGPRKPFFESAAALEHAEFPARPWLIRGLAKRAAVWAIAGEPKTTKTWSLCEAAMGVATGTPVFGEFPTGAPAPVALFLAEDEMKNVRDRLRALACSRGLSYADATRNIYVQSRTSMDLADVRDLAHLVASVRELPAPPALIGLDPLRDLHRADENDSKEMSRVTHGLRAVRDVTSATLAFVHHSIKSSKETSGRRPAQRMRGSSAIHGAVDATLSFLDLTGDTRNVWMSRMHAETRAGLAAGYFSLRLEVDDDEDGDALAARWTFAREAKDMAPPTAGKPITDRQNAFLRFLRNRFEMDRKEGVEVRPMSSRELAALIKPACSDKTAGLDLARLQTLGRVTFADVGEGRSRAMRGWIYVPTDEEADPFES